jgi:hypothetical protein
MAVKKGPTVWLRSGHVPAPAKDSDKASEANPAIVYAHLLFWEPKHRVTSSGSKCLGLLEPGYDYKAKQPFESRDF